MSDYKITKISKQEPKEVNGSYGTTYYIKVMLEGHEKPVSIGKKSPDALKEGDIVHGTITETQYETDKFTADKTQFTNRPAYQPKDEDGMAWGNALNVAVIALEKGVDREELLDYATYIFNNRNNGGSQGSREVNTSPSGTQGVQNPKSATTQADNVIDTFDDSEPIDLKDIPF